MCSATISIAATTASTTSTVTASTAATTTTTTTTSATRTGTTNQYYHYRDCNTIVTVALYVIAVAMCARACAEGGGDMFQISAHSPRMEKHFETQLHASLYCSGEERALLVVYPFPLSKVCLECLVNMLFSSLVVMQMWNITY